jgi:hypothetical protein
MVALVDVVLLQQGMYEASTRNNRGALLYCHMVHGWYTGQAFRHNKQHLRAPRLCTAT